MRIALLSTLNQASEPGAPKAAFRMFAGRTVLSHQLDLAIDLGCEAVICLVDRLTPEVIACQHRADGAGVAFNAVEGIERLLGIAGTSDVILVIADGLLADPDLARMAYGIGTSVVTIASGQAQADGFERIDAEHVWAGLLTITGDSLQRLGDLPPDSDTVSALLRIALQRGAKRVELPAAALADGLWLLASDTTRIGESERQWIAGHAAPAPFSAPGRAIAERIGLRLARDVLGGRFARVPLIVAGVTGLSAGIAAWLHWPVTGLALTGLMALATAVAAVFSRLAHGTGRRRGVGALPGIMRWLLDLLTIALVALGSAGKELWPSLFVPLILLGLLHLGERRGPVRLRALFSDRILLLLLLWAAAWPGYVQQAGAALALVSLFALILVEDPAPLTAD